MMNLAEALIGSHLRQNSIYSTSPPRRLKLDTAMYRLNVAIVLRVDVLLTSSNYLGSSAPYDYLTDSAYTLRPYVHVLEYL